MRLDKERPKKGVLHVLLFAVMDGIETQRETVAGFIPRGGPCLNVKRNQRQAGSGVGRAQIRVVFKLKRGFVKT